MNEIEKNLPSAETAAAALALLSASPAVEPGAAARAGGIGTGA